jgi:type I restriction enzyme S subunit
MSNREWSSVTLGDVTIESRKRAGSHSSFLERPVYGVDRSVGLTSVAKYTASNLEKYKTVEHGMFAYNPMRLNIGSIGYCSPEMQPGLVSPDYVVFECNRDDLNPEFLSYYINSPSWKDWTASAGVGSVRMRIYYKEIARLPLLLPSLQEQCAISEVLGTLDDKIEVNRRMNQTLESMARAVFRQWFVEGEENDWEEKSLDETADFLNGLALQKFPVNQGDEYLPVIKIAQLRTNNTESADRASTDIPPQYVVEDGDILFSWSGSLTVVAWCGGKGALNQHLFKVTSEKYPKWFYYYWTKHHLPEFQAIAAGKATTMGHIQRHHLSDAKVLVPRDKELQEMDKVMSPILDKIISNEKESHTLASLRDTLLSKLMRGEVRVKAVEKQL